MNRVTYEEAYPGVEFLPRSRNWWARLRGVPAECRHLDEGHRWMATLLPDTLYLRGKASARRGRVRPEVSLCRDCLLDVVGKELTQFSGRIVAFEPDGEAFSQYFFVGRKDFGAAGLTSELSSAIGRRLDETAGNCSICEHSARWLWFSHAQIPNLDAASEISLATGERFCAAHGAERFCRAFRRISEANLFYVNLPYGDAGAYVWI